MGGVSGFSRQSLPLRRFAEGAALLAILAIAAYLRFMNLNTNPGWYSDEGTVAEIARNYSEGRTQYLALKQSTLLVARFPVVPLMVSALLPPGGIVLETLRMLAGSLGVLSTLGVYAVVRISAGRRAGPQALLAALLFAVYRPAVFYSRIGFSYNLLTPLVLIVLGSAWIYLDRGKRLALVAAALAVGLGAATDLMMLSVAAPMVVILAFRRPRELLWWIPLSVSPLALYALTLILNDPQVFFFDLDFILRLMSAVPWWAQVPMVALNFGTLALDDPWWIPAIVGILLVSKPRNRRLLLLSFLLPLVLLARTAGLAGVRLYSISPLFPFIAIGMGELLWQGVPRLLSLGRRAASDFLAGISQSGKWPWMQARVIALTASGLVFLIVLTPLLVSSFQLVSEVRGGFRKLEQWAYLSVPDARAAIEYVNLRTAPTDLVVASPAAAWSLDAQRVDFQQALAYEGIETVDYPDEIPVDRFAFEANFRRARYAIVDPIWRDWGAAHLPAVEAMLQEIEGWPIVLQVGSIEVRENAD
jgi:4-amino-4-deoxy-L-arabinose transferase-like glycosyltransferase